MITFKHMTFPENHEIVLCKALHVTLTLAIGHDTKSDLTVRGTNIFPSNLPEKTHTSTFHFNKYVHKI